MHTICFQMVSLIQDPNGEKIFQKTTGETELSASMSAGGRRRSVRVTEQRSRVEQLEARIVELENTLELREQEVC